MTTDISIACSTTSTTKSTTTAAATRLIHRNYDDGYLSWQEHFWNVLITFSPWIFLKLLYATKNISSHSTILNYLTWTILSECAHKEIMSLLFVSASNVNKEGTRENAKQANRAVETCKHTLVNFNNIFWHHNIRFYRVFCQIPMIWTQIKTKFN
jgi:hypothetical protein